MQKSVNWKFGEEISSPVTDHTKINFSDLTQPEKYHVLISTVVPRPIAWVSTISEKGVGNLAPYSFFNAVSSNPPCVMFSVANSRAGKKHTLKNIEQTKEFVINLAPTYLIGPMSCTASMYPEGVDELKEIGLTSIPSTMISPVRVKESPVNLECKLFDIKNIGGDGAGGANIIFGEVLVAHIWDEAIQNGKIIFEKLSPLGRLGGADYIEPGNKITYVIP